jgi:hypothetical protein
VLHVAPYSDELQQVAAIEDGRGRMRDLFVPADELQEHDASAVKIRDFGDREPGETLVGENHVERRDR